MKRKIKIIGRIIASILVFVLLLLTFSLLWAKNNYGNIGFEEIVFHLNMPLQGAAENFVYSYIKTALLPALLFSIGYVIFVYWRVKNTPIFPIYLRVLSFTLIIIIWAGMLMREADRAFAFGNYVVNQLKQSKLIENEYVDPQSVELRFPEKKRNLICIYIESAETSAQNRANGGVFEENYIPEMTEIAKNNISFSQSELLEGAAVAPASGWTIAGLVAETSGLPLKLYKYDDTKDGLDNAMGNYASFMPGATTLGDILSNEGYYNVFMAGSNFNFGGRTAYFTQHGSYEIWDYYTAIEKGKIDKDYHEWWGFEDEKLYSYAKEKILEVASKEQPFNFSMLTADTHHQNGYVCELCPNTYEGQYENVWACASKQLDEFLKWIQEQEFYENTTVAIMGDHCSMDSDFYQDITYDKHKGETVRKVYNAFVNSEVTPVNEKNRKFTTLDMFPSVLASLGVEIEGDRLGLGTNMFSEEETLSEKYGYEYFFDELNKKSSFFDNEILYP